MPWLWKHKQQLPGKPISARTLRRMAQTCDWVAQVKAEPPLSVSTSFNGILFRYIGMLFSVYIAVTDGTITARSGSTPGTGNVTLQTWNGTALASLGIDKPVFNFSSTTGGIPTGKYCVILRICGSYWIISTEC